MTAGYFTVPHEVAERLLALDDGAWSFGAYCWLCKKAAWGPRIEIVSRRQITIGKGQICVAQRYLAKAWNCSLGRVQRFLAMIREWNEVDYAAESGQMLITLCRLAEKPAFVPASESPTGTGSDTPSGTKIEESKDSSSVAEATSVCEARARVDSVDEVQVDREFDGIWSIWPRKEREARSRAAYRRKRRIVDKDELAAGVRRLAARYANVEQRFVPLLATVFDEGLWREQQAEILLPLNPDASVPPAGGTHARPRRGSTAHAAFNTAFDRLMAAAGDSAGVGRQPPDPGPDLASAAGYG